MIQIKTISLRNFLSVKEVDIDLNKCGLVLVDGPNGSGKSTVIVEALCFALFGLSERFGRLRDNIVNRFVGKDMSVIVNLEVDEIDMRIEAYRKHSKYKDQVFLYINGKDKRGATNEETWGRVTKILGIDYTTFINSVVLGQALNKYFSLMSDAEQKQIIERILGVEWISKVWEISKEKQSGLEKSKAVKEAELDLIKKDICQLEEEIEKLNKMAIEFDDDRRKKINELKLKFDSLVPLPEDDKELINVLKRIEILTEKIKNQEKIKGEISGLKVLLREKEIIKDRLKEKIKKLDLMDIGEVCENCGQVIDEKSLDKYKEHIKEELEMIKSEIEKIISKIRILDEEIENEIETELKTLERKADELRRKLQDIKIANARIEEQKRELVNNIKKIETEINPYIKLKNEYEEKLDNENKRKRDLIKNLEELNNELKYIKFWVEGFSNRGLKSLVIESSIEEMNKRARIYADWLGGKYDIKFNVQKQLKAGDLREKFNIEVRNKFGADEYIGNSSGEKRLIDVIVMFVLSDLVVCRNSRRFSLLVLDDVFEKLDEWICDSIMGLLRGMIKGEGGLYKRDSILVLTHLDYFKDKFERRWEVSRDENGFTRVSIV